MIDSMDWVRGSSIGFGSFSTVNLAIPRINSTCSLMAVKSCDAYDSVLLENEKHVLNQLGYCDHIIRCLGSEESFENGQRLFNLLLEYATGGSLSHYVKKNGGCLQESDVRHYTRSILKGLSFIHAKGFAHCDIKLQNLLLFEDGEVKIADFGLAKKAGETLEKIQVRGTPLYMAPESVNENEYDSGCDIWALGCAVAEMITGKPAWNCSGDVNVASLLIKIGVSNELPEIPQELSEQGKHFLSKCFVKDPQRRWTADMLLNHPFVAADCNSTSTVTLKNKEEQKEELLSSSSSSPRCPFDFQEWISSSPKSELWSHREELESRIDWSSLSIATTTTTTTTISPADRIQKLACDTDQGFNWASSDSWITVR